MCVVFGTCISVYLSLSFFLYFQLYLFNTFLDTTRILQGTTFISLLMALIKCLNFTHIQREMVVLTQFPRSFSATFAFNAYPSFAEVHSNYSETIHKISQQTCFKVNDSVNAISFCSLRFCASVHCNNKRLLQLSCCSF